MNVYIIEVDISRYVADSRAIYPIAGDLRNRTWCERDTSRWARFLEPDLEAGAHLITLGRGESASKKSLH